MTNEDKQLLLADICARLPYGIKVKHELQDWSSDISSIDMNRNVIWVLPNKQGLLSRESAYNVEHVKPFLRPMSSMTEEEEKEYSWLISDGGWGVSENLITDCIDWLNTHHFDYRGLIEKGLAIEVTKNNNPYKD